MATLLIDYDARNAVIKHLINAIVAAGAKTTTPTTTAAFDKSIQELKAGKIHRLKNTQNPLAEILG